MPGVMSAEDLTAYIQSALPFLEEAWEACFRGQKERLLSAEARGMGLLLSQFREIVQGERVIPPGLVEANKVSEAQVAATRWAHRLLGDPNSLKPELKQWMKLGETCADGLRRANARVEELERAIAADTSTKEREKG